jgi:hypothetical protein
MVDQPVARPLPTQGNTNRINAHNTDIHVLSGIRTHDPSVRVSEDSSCFRPRGHCGQQCKSLATQLFTTMCENRIVNTQLPIYTQI